MKLTAAAVEGFVTSILKKHFQDAAETPQCHREWWQMCCSDRKFVAIAAPRGHAKSTAITFAYTLAAVLFRERRFVLIVSDTEAQSTLFLGSIKKELADNEDLRILFGVKGFQKETESDLIVEFEDGHLARLIAKGSEQKLRGLNWNGTRPDLIVGDDMENDEIVLNKDRREKFKRWFMGALVPSLARNGVLRLVGTILHMDSLLEQYMPKAWKKDTIIEPLCVRSDPKSALWLAAKYRAHTAMLDFTEILWPEYKTREWLKTEQAMFLAQGNGDIWAQEMLNEPIDDSNALFRKADFCTITEEDREIPLNIYCAMDLAVSKDNVKRDYSVFTIFGVTPDTRVHVINIIKLRMDVVEIIDTIMQIQSEYEPGFFIGEKGTIDKSIRPFLLLKMAEMDLYPILHSVAVNNNDKIIRSTSIRGRMRAGMVKFDKEADWFPDLEQECIQFPRSRHDDQVDTLSLIGIALNKYVRAATREERLEEEYEEEKEQSGWSDQGRSAITGY